MTTTPPQNSGDEAPPPADIPESPAAAPAVTEYCARGNHTQCHGTVIRWPPDDTGNIYHPCECPVPDCGHGRRDRMRK